MEQDTSPTHFIAPTVEALAPHFPAYEVEHFIAQGGMGAVYQAKQISLDRQVAIKILPREFGQDETFRASFEAEAKAMAKLNDPNLISVYDFGEADGMLFLVMEYVNGKSLYHSSHGQAIDPSQAAEIVGSICKGLDHAHQAGILHRDVKPANILLTPEAVPKIGDFGLAKPIDEAASPDEVVYGTPGYTAPEVINGHMVDRRADIFSVGVILHELLTGSLPDEARTPPSTLAGTPIGFDSVIDRSTNPNPEMRYRTAEELANAIESAAKTNPAAALNLSTAPDIHRSQIVTHTVKKSKTGPIFAATLALVVFVVAAVAFSSKDKSSANEPVNKPEIISDKTPKPGTTRPVALIPPKPKETDKPIVTKKPKESVWQALARLRAKLASGKRDEFPTQAVEHEGDHLMLVEQKMTWSEAQIFAAEYGAHLAVLPTQEKRRKLAQTLGITAPAWLAAGMAARDQWQWMDTSMWETPGIPKPATTNDRAILINSGGNLVARAPNTEHPFILHWRKDASNPCTLDEQLERTSQSIKSSGIDKATYPVGTRTFVKSHFLLTKKSLSWDDAREFAKSQTAHLAVPSTPDKQQWLTQTYTGKGITAWLGGYLINKNSPWRWITNETFSPYGWKPGEPSSDISHNRILMSAENSRADATWTSSVGEQGEATHILLEWSIPTKTITNRTNFDLDKWLTSVNRKIADRVSPLIETYKKEREKEIDKYVRDMKRAARKVKIPELGRRGAGRFSEYIQDLVDDSMDEVKNAGEITANIPDRAPKEFHKLNSQARKSIAGMDNDHQEEMKKQLDFYTDGLLKKALNLEDDGYTRQSSSLRELVENIGDDTAAFKAKIGL